MKSLGKCNICTKNITDCQCLAGLSNMFYIPPTTRNCNICTEDISDCQCGAVLPDITIKVKDVSMNLPVKCYICHKEIICNCPDHKQWSRCLLWTKDHYPRAFPYNDFVSNKLIHVCSRTCKNKLPADCYYRNLLR